MKRVPKAPPPPHENQTSERSKEVQSKFGPSLACIYEQYHPISNELTAKQHNKALSDSESNKNYTTVNPVPQTMENGATPSGQETENVSEAS